MLRYFKLILEKVAFDARLFEKELRKSIARLVPAEIEELREWCYERFASLHQNILDRCFMTLA